ncbi:RagB/SusD family nutrient uptake outer membrane protein [Chitinophaga oryzae]|uniref:RagB/SusD family nutrient uptake outer membrane protein n=1 Tax=Chitinophaga oryzae TaxID=2725414 RepID=A0AAE6ZBV6_9BACT|nr:RagB/SusD family nutrient uptake outer membrane protein [Chitinophaga oryzae]QJB29829.1 RagB/SusD family nutrient uptake outer membrane protein [Chitinophaga oryzae]QJB36385.1 RagB/SusD family nutrient uptake outer membrane protein [Chitinophaga oryzae]
MTTLRANIKTALLLLLLAGGIQSCKLDGMPGDRYTDAAIWKDAANVDLYVYGLYDQFKPYTFGQFPIGYSNATDAFTDIEKYTSNSMGNGTVNRLAYNPGQVNAASPGISVWDDAYGNIRRINEFLNGMQLYAKLTDQQKTQFEAEVRYLRAYNYFWLARVNGSVIIMDKLPVDKSQARSSEDDVWNFIAADLNFAAQHLPKQWPAAQKGRVTQGAAYGLLSRAWLYAASVADYDNKQFNKDPLTGVPSSKKTEYYQHAADAAAAVIGLGIYDLETDYAKAFSNNNSKEAIFALYYQRPGVTHQLDFYFAPPADVAGGGATGVPTAELVNEYEMADGRKFSWSEADMKADPYAGREPRFYASVIYNGASWKGRTINTTPDDDKEGYIDFKVTADPRKTVTGYYRRKMLDETNTDILVLNSNQPWVEMRYAEILLIHAEALTKLGKIGDAKISLNKVRARVNLPGTPAATPEAMMAAIEHERKVELAFEGHRYWDLRRWRKAHIVLNNVRFHGHKVTSSGNGFDYTEVDCDKENRYFPASFYYLPITQNEIVTNPAMKQIQGW